MRLLVLEYCDFVSYPTGGQLAFVRNMLKAFPAGELKLAGIDTEGKTKTGVWTKLEIGGVEYDYFSVNSTEKSSSRPFVPRRISAYFEFKRHIRNILSIDYDYIFVQAPEVLLSIPLNYLDKVFLDMPGVGNPLEISRYWWAKKFSKLFDSIYLRRVSKVGKLLVTASSKDIEALLSRSNGRLDRNRMIQFPTRYDSNVFHHIDRDEARKVIGTLANFRGIM